MVDLAGRRLCDGALTIAGEDAESLARHGRRSSCHDRSRFAERPPARWACARDWPKSSAAVRSRHIGPAGAGGPPRPVRDRCLLARRGDACLECGWVPDEIGFTGTNVSERDLDVLLPPVTSTSDASARSTRLRGAPGRVIGLRINPRCGGGLTRSLAYSGERRRSSAFTRTDSRCAGGCRPPRLDDQHDPLRRLRLAGRGGRRLRSGPCSHRGHHGQPRGRRSSDRRGERRRWAQTFPPGRPSIRSISRRTPRSAARHLGARCRKMAAGGNHIARTPAILLGRSHRQDQAGCGQSGPDLRLVYVNCSYFIYRYAGRSSFAGH